MLSVTSLSTYLYCPRKSFIEVVLKIKRPPKAAMVKGTVRHNAFDIINRQEEDLIKSIKTDNFNEIFEIFKKNHFESLKESVKINNEMIRELNIPIIDLIKEAWQNIVKESEEKAKQIHEVIKQKGVYGEDLWNSIEIRTQSEVRINSENLKLRGIIDQVKITKKEIIPYELKTGSAPSTGVWPSHRFQIGSYILLLNDKHGKTNTGFIKYLDINSERSVAMNPFLREEILSTRDKIFEFQKTKEIPEIINDKKKCQVCELAPICYNKKLVQNKIIEVKNNTTN
ncbi:MAG: CRISPR-associated protein Cas4 [Candidatus Woesearchaeota archaeon]